MAPAVGIGTEGPVQRGWNLWVVSVVMVSVAGLFVIARFIERMRRHGLGVDDWIILAALLSSAVLSVTEIEAVKNGYGVHANTLTQEQLTRALIWFFAAQIVYKVVITLDKISILCFYYRIFKVDRSFRIAAQTVNAFIILSAIAYIIATIFQCTPIRAFWDSNIPSSRLDNKIFWVSYASINILTDIVILGLPVPRVMRLSISRPEKFGLMLVFGAGAFATATTIARTTTLVASSGRKDPTWSPLPATMWSVIEPNAGIIAACLPILRSPFIALLTPYLVHVHNTPPKGDQGQSGRVSGGCGMGLNGRTEAPSREPHIARGGRKSCTPSRAHFDAYGYPGEDLDLETRQTKSSNYGDNVANTPTAADSDSGPFILQRPGLESCSSISKTSVAVDHQPAAGNPPAMFCLQDGGCPSHVNSDLRVSVSGGSAEKPSWSSSAPPQDTPDADPGDDFSVRGI